MKRIFVRAVAVPQEHGSWVFLISPLLIGLCAGERFARPSLYLVVAALAAFLLRQPATAAVKAYSGRRARAELGAAWFWMFAYFAVALAALAGLVLEGFGYVLLLAIPGVPVFAWHLYLVGRRAERRKPGVEIVAAGALALAAPAGLWVGKGAYDPIGWVLWLLVWLQSAASIVYAYLRLEQRVLPGAPPRSVRRRMGRRALMYTSFNLAVSLAGGLGGLLPSLIFVPYLLQWLETVQGIERPAIGFRPTRIGVRQLIVSSLFTLLFILAWR